MASFRVILALTLLPSLSLCALEKCARVDLGVDSSKPVLGDLPVKIEPPTCALQPEDTVLSCDELYHNGSTKSGVYKVPPGFRVYCSMGHLGAGWTVILRRINQSQAFLSDKTYQHFVDGFGNFSDNFFLGLDSIHSLTKKGTYQLYIGMEYPANAHFPFIFAFYNKFSVGSKKSGYKLKIGSYDDKPRRNFHAGGNALSYHNGAAFHAKGSPTSNENCGIKYGGWWYTDCNDFFGQHSNYMRWQASADSRLELVSFVMAIKEVK